jgi:hypothetical protein
MSAALRKTCDAIALQYDGIDFERQRNEDASRAEEEKNWLWRNVQIGVAGHCVIAFLASKRLCFLGEALAFIAGGYFTVLLIKGASRYPVYAFFHARQRVLSLLVPYKINSTVFLWHTAYWQFNRNYRCELRASRVTITKRSVYNAIKRELSLAQMLVEFWRPIAQYCETACL